MAWVEPKTDWVETDYFNIEDYNRIIGNLYYLKELSNEIFNSFSISDMNKKISYSEHIYAREVNDIENNLEAINLSTYVFNLGEKQVYRDNGPTPLWSEFNRIENAVFLLYKTMKAHKNALYRMEFTLGSEKGIRV